jgi:hypothetical protein
MVYRRSGNIAAKLSNAYKTMGLFFMKIVIEKVLRGLPRI